MSLPVTCTACRLPLKSEGRWNLGISGLILIFLPLIFGSSPRCGSKDLRSVPVWESIMCFVSDQNKTDIYNPPFKRKVQLYSRASRLHIQIKKTEINARGRNGSEYARLILESDNFGRLKIKGEKSNRYLCISRTGELVPRVKMSRFAEMKRCIFKEEITGHGYFQYRSVRFPQWFIGFSKGGLARNGSKSAKRQRFRQFTHFKVPFRLTWNSKQRRHAQLRRKLINMLRTRIHLRKV